MVKLTKIIQKKNKNTILFYGHGVGGVVCLNVPNGKQQKHFSKEIWESNIIYEKGNVMKATRVCSPKPKDTLRF